MTGIPGGNKRKPKPKAQPELPHIVYAETTGIFKLKSTELSQNSIIMSKTRSKSRRNPIQDFPNPQK
jgi:hypothetical protein